MFRLLGKMPRSVVVAVSGGADSMAVLNFLSKNHEVTAAFFHHGTAASDQGFRVITAYCSEYNLPLMVGYNHGLCPAGQSQEEWWRNRRYEFFDSLGDSLGPVITAHHLDDVVETWIWSSLHGTAKLIPYRRNSVIRPFMLNPKQEFVDWCLRHGVPWHEDPTNQDTDYIRNHIRHRIVPEALVVNPGIHTMLAKKIKAAVKSGVDDATQD